MRINRTPDEWRTLLEEQQRSGLNKTQFCRRYGITRSAFSNACHRFFADNSPATAFVQALPPSQGDEEPASPDCLPAHAPTLSLAAVPAPQVSRQLALTLPGATLTLPLDISPRWLATLLREIAP